MKNHPFYKKFKQKISKVGLAIKGVKLLNFDDAANLLGERKFSNAFLTNMKSLLVAEMQDQQDESNKQLFAAKVEALRNKFPDFEVERGREGDKPFITIWLKSKPEIETEEA